MSSLSPLVVALDFADAKTALSLAHQLDPQNCQLKVGKELFTAAGPQLLEKLMGLGFEIFLDLKFHDIPNTVASAMKVVSAFGVWMVNVHALGGKKMMIAAREALEKTRSKKPLLIAVTVLTSLSQKELNQVGFSALLEDQVLRLARLSSQAGVDGVVCSAREAPALRHNLGSEFILVTPGIRPIASANDDQCRIVTPAQAIAAGSDYLVIGRPITRADEPALACEKILQALKIVKRQS